MGAGPESEDTVSDDKALRESEKAQAKPSPSVDKSSDKNKTVLPDADDVDDLWDNLPI